MSAFGPVSWKLYRCTNCGDEKEIQTNHFGPCYPPCRNCEPIGPKHWECIELLRLARNAAIKQIGALP